MTTPTVPNAPAAPNAEISLATQVYRRTRVYLDGKTRLTLALGGLLTLTMTGGLYLILQGLSMVYYMLVGSAADTISAMAADFVGRLYDLLYPAILLLIGAPLLGAVYRMAVLTVCAQSQVHDAHETYSVTMLDCFYPFTFGSAYRRCLRVGVELAVWPCMIIVPVPLLLFGFVSLRDSGVLSSGGAWLAFLCLMLGLGFSVLFLCLSCRRVGFGYTVFAHPEMTLAVAAARFRAFRRPLRPVLGLYARHIGWIVLSFVAVLVPFLFHTIPSAMLCGAEYGRRLEDDGRM